MNKCIRGLFLVFLVSVMLLQTAVYAMPIERDDMIDMYDNKEPAEFDDDNLGYYAYYYNINSAYGDMYWRVYNSNYTPSQKYLFVSYDDNMFELVDEYADCVDQMIKYYGIASSSKEVVLVKSVFSTISVAVAIASGNTINAIVTTIEGIVEIADDVDENILENIAYVYLYADLANDYYKSIIDA